MKKSFLSIMLFCLGSFFLFACEKPVDGVEIPDEVETVAEDTAKDTIISDIKHEETVEEIDDGREPRKLKSKYLITYFDAGKEDGLNWAEYEYDDYGNLICEKRYADESLDSIDSIFKWEYYYDTKEMRVKSYEVIVKDYNNTGELYTFSKEEYEYDEEGNMINAAENVEEQADRYRYDKEYDDEGRLIYEAEWFDADGQFDDDANRMYLKKYNYNEKGELVAYYYVGVSNAHTFALEQELGGIYWEEIHEYYYDDVGNLVEDFVCKGREDSKVNDYSIDYYYDDEGRLQHEAKWGYYDKYIEYDENGNIKAEYSFDQDEYDNYEDKWVFYEYDENGNLIREIKGNTRSTPGSSATTSQADDYHYYYDDDGDLIKTENYYVDTHEGDVIEIDTTDYNLSFAIKIEGGTLNTCEEYEYITKDVIVFEE